MKIKILVIMLILIILINGITPIVNATQIITKANLKKGDAIPTHILYENNNGWFEVKCNYIYYQDGEDKYPAYCISPGIHGVDEEGDYTVNIDKLVENNIIYNIIVNGYPYKTYKQLNVESDYDAYVATKLAIKNVLLNRDIVNFYKPMDERGQKIIEAMVKIAEVGKIGNATNKDAALKIEKIGSLIEKGDYYYQEYSVNSNVNISKYNIQNIENLPTNSLVTDVYGNVKTNFINNENFRIMIPKLNLNENIDGKININASCNTRPVFYGKAPNASIQDYAITYKPYAEYQKTVNLNLVTNTASIKIEKKDQETSKPLPNVLFGLYKENGEHILTKSTDTSGIATFNNLYQGKYFLKELEENADYIKDENTYEMEAEYNKEITKIITNMHKKGNLKITKVDKDNTDITLGAIEFDLLNENGEIVSHLTTDVNGEAELTNINTGKYTLKETKTKKEYNLCEDTDILVKWNETSEKTIENEKQKGKIKIIKEDLEDSNIKLSGIKFRILNKKDEIVEEIETNENGEAISSRLLIGEYKIKEVDLGNNKNYLLNNEIHIVQVENNKTIEVTIKNEHKKGNIKILKTDKDDKNILLKGVKFEIEDSYGLKFEAITNENGIAQINNIRIGNVKIKEVETNNEYVILNKVLETTIEYNKVSEINVENEKKKGQVEIYKTDKENKNIHIPNVEFAIMDKDNKIIDKIKTNEDGYGISKRIAIGEYYLKEVKTNGKYVIDDRIIKIEIKENEVLKMEITNEKIKGQIQIIKTSSKDSPIVNIKEGEYLPNVIFEIFNNEGKLVDTLITDDKGQAISNKLEVGRYKIKEKSTNKHYILNKNEFIVNIERNNEIKILNIENEPIIPNINIEKNGQQYAQRNEEIKYEFEIENKSNTKLDNFNWVEYIPYEKCNITKMITGIYNEEINYEIYYKTNLNDYKLYRIINSLKNEYINFDDLKLSKDEIITEIKVNYKSVSRDFQAIAKPEIYVKVNENVKKNDKIINKTEISGNIEDEIIKDTATFETIIKEKEKMKKLPKTGC